MIPLARTQRDVLQGLGCWPDLVQHVEWYAGSALINAWKLADHPGSHTLDCYEWDPGTRPALRRALAAAQLPPRISWEVLAHGDETREFDGESYVEREIGNWGRRDLILLDPFAMWVSPKDQHRRDLYGRIFEIKVPGGRADEVRVSRSDNVGIRALETWTVSRSELAPPRVTKIDCPG